MVNLIATSMAPESSGTPETRIGDLPHDIRIEADLRIPLSDGRRLSARLWIPIDADINPVPALVEYAPFRHRDFTYPRDAIIHPWFAGHGYASIRLEPAGSQDSDGPPMDEYVAREQEDCVEALAWIAAQDWCAGTTGMFGMSWGAFSALQVAALRPPSLKAIIPVHGTDDRYNDDIHYKGGCRYPPVSPGAHSIRPIRCDSPIRLSRTPASPMRPGAPAGCSGSRRPRIF